MEINFCNQTCILETRVIPRCERRILLLSRCHKFVLKLDAAFSFPLSLFFLLPDVDCSVPAYATPYLHSTSWADNGYNNLDRHHRFFTCFRHGLKMKNESKKWVIVFESVDFIIFIAPSCLRLIFLSCFFLKASTSS